MTCSRAWLTGFAFVYISAAATSQRFAVTIRPSVVEVGSPELIEIAAPDAATIDGDWMGQKLAFFRGCNGRCWFSLAGVDVEAAAGPSTLRIRVKTGDGLEHDESRSLEVHEAHYQTGTLSVEPKFVEPSPEAIEEIRSEIALKDKIFGQSDPQPLWSGNFRAPVTAPPTDSFGTRRIFNGKLASVHKGMDFRAHPGTPVHAGNSGVVVLARPLYFEGNCVAVDHGMGLFTISMHLSRIDVHEGERVAKGQRLGLSGATGRVTGPHLHWAVRWEGAYLDPAKLLKMNLAAVR
jgi:murein DD-endopeptidase MepM/ murein hydrolase activator NlpD